MEKLASSIEKAFLEEDDISLKEFHPAIQDNLAESQKNLRKARSQLVIFALLYFIIIQSSVQAINIGPFKIENLNIIIKIFPIILVVKFYEFIDIQLLTKILYETQNAVIKKLYPKIYENNLELLFTDDSCMETYELRNPSTNTNIQENIRLLILVLQLLILPFSIIFYSLYNSFSKFGMKDILVWVILFIVLLFLTHIVYLLVENQRQNES
jgi:hypothetical protein